MVYIYMVYIGIYRTIWYIVMLVMSHETVVSVVVSNNK